MPTYEYECQKCGKLFEHFQSMKDEPLRDCPDQECGGTVKRLISAGAGLIFKGTGFYITDYRDKKSGGSSAGSGDTGSSGGSGDSGSEGKSEAKSKESVESKTEAKPETKREVKASDSGSKSDSGPSPGSKS